MREIFGNNNIVLMDEDLVRTAGQSLYIRKMPTFIILNIEEAANNLNPTPRTRLYITPT